MTRQQIFNTAYHGLAAQGFRQALVMKGGSFACSYRGTDGMRCALGYCIPDSVYRREFDFCGTSSISGIYHKFPEVKKLFKVMDIPFLQELQNIHDGNMNPDGMQSELLKFAQKHSLTVPVLPVTADAPAPIEVKEHEYADHG